MSLQNPEYLVVSVNRVPLSYEVIQDNSKDGDGPHGDEDGDGPHGDEDGDGPRGDEDVGGDSVDESEVCGGVEV